MNGTILPWLLLLPLAAIAAVPPAERPGAVTRVVMAGFGLATLATGAGELALDTLGSYARQSPGNALFVSLSAGLLLGAAVPWRRRAWPSWAAVLVVAAVAAWPIVGAMHWGGYLLGAVLGAVPLLLGRSLPSRLAGRSAPSEDEPHEPLAALLLATVVALAEPFALALLAPVVPLVWRGAWRGNRWRLVLPGVAVVAAAGLGWLALTIAGHPLVRLAGYFTVAPVSLAAERWLALLAVVMVVAMLAPWPLGRLGRGATLGPAAAILAWRLAGSLAPDLMAAWQPLLGMVLVPSAVIAAWRGRWAGALATAAVVVALHPGRLPLLAVGAALLAALATSNGRSGWNLSRPDRVTFTGEWWVAMLAAVGLTATSAALLAHEVVLATLLAGGMGSAAARAARGARSA